MQLFEIVLIALGLSMDACAVCIAASAARRTRPFWLMPMLFGVFQFLMPLFGWIIGAQIERQIAVIDHWIAYGLLALVGCRMIVAGAASGPKTASVNDGSTLLMLSVATSIDALAVGLSLAMFKVGVWYASVLIGLVTFVLCLIGMLLGHRLGERFGRRMEIFGGSVLIVIGINILVTHLWSQTG